MLHSIPEKQEIYGSGRTLEWLRDKVVESQNNGRYAIFGLGGIGKTSIMLEFAYQIQERHPGIPIFRVTATSGADFKESYMDIFTKLKAHNYGAQVPVRDLDVMEFVQYVPGRCGELGGIKKV